MKDSFSTAEVASLLSVNDSTVKRWSDDGFLACVRTKGKHRRFTLSALMKFLQENRLQMPEMAAKLFIHPELHAQLLIGNTNSLIEELQSGLVTGDKDRTLAALRIGLTVNEGFLEFCTRVVRPVCARFDEGAARDSIPVDEARLAWHTLRESLSNLRSELHTKPSPRGSAVCACYEGEVSEIDLDCMAMYLVSEGWKVFHYGPDMPTSGLVKAIERRNPGLVVVSAVNVQDDWKFQKDISTVVKPAIRQAGGRLCVAGPGLRKRFGRKLQADFVINSVEEIADVNAGFPSPTL